MSDSGQRDDGVKHLTLENWSQPDDTGRAFGAIHSATGERRDASGDSWAEQFLAAELNGAVPPEIRDMWEVARGLALYGWFYYPLYAIAEHQLRRVADAAVLHRYKQAGGPPHKKRDPEGDVRWPDFKRRVEWLIANGIVAPEKRRPWDTMRDLRNETTHASIRHLVMPIDVLRLLDLLAPEIDALFVPRPSMLRPCGSVMFMLMALFAHRFLTPPGSEPSMPPGHYDGSLALRVDDAGLPVAETLRALPTRADRDRPDVLSTITKAERDRDRDGIAAQLGTKPAGERAKDAVARDSLWGPPEL